MGSSNTVILPRPGKVLHKLVTATGYRSYLERTGADKDLDDQAAESRKGSNFELLSSCLSVWLGAISKDCGKKWANLADASWKNHCDLLRSLTRSLDCTDLLPERAEAAIIELLIIPELSAFIRRAHHEFPLPNLPAKEWWDKPFAVWVVASAENTGQTADCLLEKLATHRDIDQRTLERWQAGAVMRKSLHPYGTLVRALVDESVQSTSQTEKLTGWLVMSIALQSLPEEMRRRIEQSFESHGKRQLKTEEQFMASLKQASADRSRLLVRRQIAQWLETIQPLFVDARKNANQIEGMLTWIQDLCVRGTALDRSSLQYVWFWFSARLAANLEKKDEALRHYASACELAWWRGGPHQHAILHEALCYAVGVGAKIQANHYWDKCYLLGLNEPPKRELDQQELRRISFEFEVLFAPQKSEYRIPPSFRAVEGPYKLTTQDLAAPNRKKALADGRVRYTPLMEAVLFGEIEDVTKLVEAGGDINIHIPESGDTALIMALRRAANHKDHEILNYLMSQDVNEETLNRPSSVKKETPLKIAVEMADAVVVQKLITLGAKIEQPCFHSPTALCYAMALLHDSIHADDPSQQQAYYDGRVPADGFDAKNGAVLDCELPALRRARLQMLQNPLTKQLYEQIKEYFLGSVEDRRAVVICLLHNGANPNRHYADFHKHASQWTPTLFAAQVGDLDVMKAMIRAGGKPWISLDPDHPHDEKNALWVAVKFKRQTVVEYLLPLLPPA